MENHQFVEVIRRELPGLLRQDPALREWVLELTRTQYADKEETKSHFDQMLDHLRQMQDAQDRKWAENQEHLRQMQDAQDRKWAENQEHLRQMQDAQDRKWRENQEAQDRKWRENQEAQDRKWRENQEILRRVQDSIEAHERKWEENQQILRQIQDSIQAQNRKHDTSIGALGARWGLYSEQAFRHGLEGILSDTFGVEVRNVTDYDEAGEVFGHPDQVELDVVIRNGVLLLVEIKSSISKADMYTFERKAAFYAQRHDQPVGRKLVISPMVDEGARQVAARLGIEVYSYAEEAPREG